MSERFRSILLQFLLQFFAPGEVRLSGGCLVLRTDPEGNQSVRTVSFLLRVRFVRFSGGCPYGENYRGYGLVRPYGEKYRGYGLETLYTTPPEVGDSDETGRNLVASSVRSR